MARSLTLGSLVARVRSNADCENDDHVSDTDIKGWISEAYGELYSVLASAYFNRNRTEDEISTDGNEDYALPADHLYTLGVVYKYSDDDYHELGEVEVLDSTRYRRSSGAPEACAWQIVDGSLRLLPRPPSGQTYLHSYVPQPADLSAASDGTSVDVATINGEVFVIRRAATAAKIKAEEDPRDLERAAERALERLTEDAVKLSLPRGRPVVVEREYYDRDVFDRRGGYY